GVTIVLLSFFVASRRRHTRSKRDWSSDVCSSDLAGGLPDRAVGLQLGQRIEADMVADPDQLLHFLRGVGRAENMVFPAGHLFVEIGRASCRGRGEAQRSEAGVEGRDSVGDTRTR